MVSESAGDKFRWFPARSPVLLSLGTFLPSCVSYRTTSYGTPTVLPQTEGKSSVLCRSIALRPPRVVRAVSLGEMDPLHYSYSFTAAVFPFLSFGEGAE